MSDVNAIKRFCRRWKAHSISVTMHTSCSFKFCKCDQCEKITNNNEIAKERARKRQADATAVPSAASSSSQMTVEQVLKLADKNSTEEDSKKHLSPAAVQAGKLQVQFIYSSVLQNERLHLPSRQFKAFLLNFCAYNIMFLTSFVNNLIASLMTKKLQCNVGQRTLWLEMGGPFPTQTSTW